MDSPFIVFKFLHIATMFAAVAGTVVPEVVLHLVANTRDARAIATMAHISERIAKVVPAAFITGAIFGLLAAWSGQMNFLAPWLLTAYVLFVTATVIGIRISDPWVARLRAAAVASGDGQPSEELEAVIEEPRAKAASVVLILIVLVFIALMVFKPGG